MSRGFGWLAGAVIVTAVAAGVYAVGWFAPRTEQVSADPTDGDLVALGETVYGAHCARCHGSRLEGQPNWRQRLPDGSLPAPPHDGSGHTWHHADRVLFDYTKGGGAAIAPAGFTSNMPGFAGVLSDREIWAVLAFIKSRWPEEIRARQETMNARAR